MNEAAAHRAAGQAIAALAHGTMVEGVSVDGIETAAELRPGDRRAELLVEIAIGLAGIAAEARFRFGHCGASDCVVSWRFTQDQIQDFRTVHEMVEELDPVGMQDVFFCAWKQALDLVGDQVFWDAIETLAAVLPHGEIIRDEVSRIANGDL